MNLLQTYDRIYQKNLVHEEKEFSMAYLAFLRKPEIPA